MRAWGLQPGPQRPPALGTQQGRPTLGGLGLARWELGPVLELLGIAGPGEPVASSMSCGLGACSGRGEQVGQLRAGNPPRWW